MTFLRYLLWHAAWLVVASACAASDDDPAAWAEDLDAYAEQLEAGHLDLFHTISEEAFRTEIARLKEEAASMSEEERLVSLMRLTRRIGDGHTSIPLWDSGLNRYPFEFTLIDDRVFVTGAEESRQALLGYEVITINDVPIANVRDRLGEIVPFVENAQSQKIRTGMYLPVEQLLVGLGIAEKGEAASFVLARDGKHEVVEVAALNQETRDALPMVRLSAVNSEAFFDVERQATETLWFGASDDRDTVYIRFDRYPSYDDMLSFGGAVRAFVDRHQSQHLIIDFRNNFGGDFFIGLALASFLNLADSIDWADGVYILTGPKTFSAAMSNAVQYKQILHGRWVGEAPGARPCGYQDMAQFTLPHSGMLVTHSKRYFCFIDSDEDSQQPDVSIPISLDALLAEKDEVLNWVMDDIANQTTKRR